jgi:cobaltochelatase CobT
MDRGKGWAAILMRSASRSTIRRLCRARADDARASRPDRGRDRPNEADEGGDESEQEQEQDGESDDEGQGEAGQAEARAEPQEGEGEESEAEYDQSQMDDMDDADGDMGEDGMQPVNPQRRNWDHLPQSDYKSWTTKYDEVVGATDLADEEELNRLRAYLDQQLSGLQGAVTRLANRLQRRLMAQQNRSWDFDQEEGLLDAARLARIVVSPGSSLSYKVERDIEFRDTVVTLLIDNQARCADARFQHRRDQRRHHGPHARTVRRENRDSGLHHPRVEGRTIARGLARRRSPRHARSPQRPAPHRLQKGRRTLASCAPQPRPDDARRLAQGKYRWRSLLWAHNRLIARPEDRRILMVISDGAPVDDSTLSVNPWRLSRTASAPRDRNDRKPQPGATGRDRHRP